MAAISVKVQGADRIARRFSVIAGSLPNTVDKRMSKWGTGTAGKIRKKSYPPKRPKQRYRRTGILKRSWHHRRLRQQVHAIKNNATQRGRTYPVFVVGDEKGKRQSWFHKGRWWTGRGEVDKYIPALVSGIKKDISKAT